MKGDGSVWYRLGAALERARLALPGGGEEDRRGRPRRRRRRARQGSPLLELLGGNSDRPFPLAGLAAAGSGTVALRLARRWADSRRPSLAALLGAAGAGAGAALARELAVAVLEREARHVDDDLMDAVLAGAGEGMIFAALVEPWLPDSPWIQGAVLGTAGYLAAPWGGVGGVLEPLAPQRSVPILGKLLEGTRKDRERPWLEHLAHGLALAFLYRALTRRGMREDA